MKTDTFAINLKEISCGDCRLDLDFGSFVLPYNASYIGDEPLSTLIEAAYALQHGQHHDYEIIWWDEPGYLRLHFSASSKSSDLTIKIAQNLEDGDFNAANEKERQITLPQKLFFEAVINAALKALKKYGICGFNRNWCNDFDTFPLHTLLQLLGADRELETIENEEGLKSDIFEELELLQNAIKQF